MVLLEAPPATQMAPSNSRRVQDQSEHRTPFHREHSRSHRNSSLEPTQHRLEAPRHSERSHKTHETSHRDSTRRSTQRASNDTRDHTHRTPTQRLLEGPRATEASRSKNTLGRSHTTREITGRSDRTHERRGITRPSYLPSIPERSSRPSGTEPGLVTRITDGLKDMGLHPHKESSLGRSRSMRDSSRYNTRPSIRGESSRTITPSRYGSGALTRGNTGMSMIPSRPSYMDSDSSRMPSFATSGRSRSRSMLPSALSGIPSRFRSRSSSFSDWSDDDDDYDSYDDFDDFDDYRSGPSRGRGGKKTNVFTAWDVDSRGRKIGPGRDIVLTDTQVGEMADEADGVKWGTNGKGKVEVQAALLGAR